MSRNQFPKQLKHAEQLATVNSASNFYCFIASY